MRIARALFILQPSSFILLFQLPVSAALILHLPFDEGSGALAADASGSARDGALASGALWLSSGRLGSALLLNDANDTALVSDDAALRFDSATSFTLCAWVYL